jgi:hypothetical protein
VAEVKNGFILRQSSYHITNNLPFDISVAIHLVHFHSMNEEGNHMTTYGRLFAKEKRGSELFHPNEPTQDAAAIRLSRFK